MISLLAAMITIGDINTQEEADAICNLIEKGSSVVVDSGGGNLNAFISLGNCIYEKKVNTIIQKALSGQRIW